MSKHPLCTLVALSLILSGASSLATSTQAARATPAPLTLSGQAMPAGDLPGWRQIFADDFNTNVPLGSFPSAVAGRWGSYPYPAKDTSHNGTYWPEKVISIHDGVMDLNLHTEGGVNAISAPQPRLFPGVSAARGQLYGRYAMRFRADAVPGYKVAWMLWPDSGTWPRDGEIDFPESNLDHPMCAFMHRLGGGSGSDQDAYCTATTYADWHTAVIEWTPASLTFMLDGAVIGKSTSRIPNTAMHWVLQTETSLSTAPAASAAGHVQIDWVAVYKLDPGAAAGPPAAIPAPAADVGQAAPSPPEPVEVKIDRVLLNDRDVAKTQSPRSSSGGSTAGPGRQNKPAVARDSWPAPPRLLADAVQAGLRAARGVVDLLGRGIRVGLDGLRQGAEQLYRLIADLRLPSLPAIR